LDPVFKRQWLRGHAATYTEQNGEHCLADEFERFTEAAELLIYDVQNLIVVDLLASRSANSIRRHRNHVPVAGAAACFGMSRFRRLWSLAAATGGPVKRPAEVIFKHFIDDADAPRKFSIGQQVKSVRSKTD
jgi:hypothetical protein